jgi:pimeloyl-ACP methyl ester carboxylesterase
MRRLAVAVCGLFLFVSHPASAITLKSCHVPDVKETVLCGVFEVPENRALQGGRILPLKVVVLPARTKPAKEPLFFLSGGPGEAATEEAPGFVGPEWLRKEHDVVLVDMRGTGEGTKLQCDLGGSDADPQAYVEPLFHEGTAYAACAKKLSKSADLTQYTTTIAMRDLDELRKALGYGKIDILSGSYGTRAAIVYLRLYGPNVRAALLSGVSALGERSPLYHAWAAERAFEILVAQCAADIACHKAFPDPKGDLDAILARLRAKPVPVTLTDRRTHKKLTLMETAPAFGDGLRLMLYDEDTGRRVPLLLARARAGDFAPFAELALEHGRGMKEGIALGLLLSVSCSEDVSRIRPEEVAKETAGSFIGDWRARGQMAACSVWPTPARPADYDAPFTADAPVLLISGNLDPVTPPRWGVEAQKYFPNSVHIIVPGAHVSGSDCIADITRRFIETADPKRLDTSCVAKTKLPPFVVKEK